MRKTALITTTINVPNVLTQWANTMTPGDDVIIVAGDHKSPHEKIKSLLTAITEKFGIETMYLVPEDQEHWRVSEVIGWNCIQRRNIALLEAMRLQPQYILTIDDDNAPTERNQVSRLENVLKTATQTSFIKTNTGWYNPGRACLDGSYHNVVHRGFPLSQRRARPVMSTAPTCPIGVAAMLWTGEPDIDAVERIANAPEVIRIYKDDVVITPGTWAPFNTQATMFDARLAPAMFMWPHVGRYDDIWASYLTRAVMDQLGWGAYYGHPIVHQERNEHDLVKDLKAEIFGMEFNEIIIEALRGVDLSKFESSQIIQMVRTLFNAVKGTNVLSLKTFGAFNAWLADVDLAMAADPRG